MNEQEQSLETLICLLESVSKHLANEKIHLAPAIDQLHDINVYLPAAIDYLIDRLTEISIGE